MQHFSLNTRLCFGENALSVLNELKPKRTLLVTDKFFSQNGKAQEILQLCGGEGKIFDGVQPDPELSVVAQGVKLLQEFSPDLLLALGGGSAIDCAKGILSMGKTPVPFVAIPTTSGTGSEVTSFAILTHEGIKHPLIEDKLRPEIAILDDALLAELPKNLIAEGGIDTVSHALEALASKNANSFTTALAENAFRTCLELLPRSFAGDRSIRADLHQAATMAGIAFDGAGLGICHALSHALGGAFHLPHGRLNAILLPHMIEFNLSSTTAYKNLAEHCGFCSPRALIFALRRLRKQLSLPETLSAAGLERNKVLPRLEELAATAAKDPCLKTNPRPATESELAALIRRVL